MISKIRYYVNETCLKNLYYSFVQSHINYNLLNWSCIPRNLLDPIEKKVKKAVRIISFAKTKYDHTTPLFKRHKILPFYELIKYKKASFLWKMSHGYISSPVCSIFTRNLHNPYHFVQPRPKNLQEKVLLEYSCVNAWTPVPESLKRTSNLRNFTVNYKEYLLKNI